MASNAQPNYPGDVVQWISDRNFCVEEKTLTDTEIYLSGSVCGDNAGGTKAPLNVDASAAPFDNDADSIYIGPKVTAATGDVGPFLVRGPAVVKASGLDYDAATSVAVADAALRVLDIQVLKSAPASGPTA